MIQIVSPFAVHRTTLSSPLPPNVSTEAPPALSADRFQASPAPLPAAPSPAEEAEPTPASFTGRSAVVGVLVAASLLGGCASVATATVPSPPTSSQSQQVITGQQARQAIESLEFLQKVAAREGGGLYQTSLGGLIRQPITPVQAFGRLADGHGVQYIEKPQTTPHEIRTLEDLRELRQRVEQKEIERNIQDGIDRIREGIDAIGDAIRGR